MKKWTSWQCGIFYYRLQYQLYACLTVSDHTKCVIQHHHTFGLLSHHGLLGGGGLQRKSSLDGATDLLSTLQQSVLRQRSLLFSPENPKTSLDVSKWVWKIIEFISNLYWNLFVAFWGNSLCRIQDRVFIKGFSKGYCKRDGLEDAFQFSPFITAWSDLYNRPIWLFNRLIWPL